MRTSDVKRVVLSLAAPAAALLFLLPALGQIQTPIKAARDAYNKSRQQQQQQQQPTQQQQARPAQAPQASSASAPVSGAPAAAEPWTPPTDAAPAPTVAPDFSKMPDVVGVRVGMTPQEALETLRKQYPKDIYQKMTVSWWPTVQKPDYGFNLLTFE